MSAKAASNGLRGSVLESLVGDTGDPVRVRNAAGALADRAALAIGRELDLRLSHPVELTLDEVTLTRQSRALPAPFENCAVLVAASGTSPDALVMVLDADAVTLVAEAAFGADPANLSAAVERPFTAIERALVAMLFEIVARAFNGSGERELEIAFPLPAPACGDEADKISLRDGPSARMDFGLRLGGRSGRLTVAMPQRVLLSKRGEAARSGDKATASAWRDRFGEEVMRSDVRLEATVPLARMTLGEISRLSVGQTLALPKDAQKQTRLSARRKTVFVCEFGRVGTQFTVRVRHPYDDGKEFMEELVSGRG